MAYTHLTKDQLYKIQSWQELGLSQTEIAGRLGKDKSTISRECSKNSYPNGRYHAGHAATLRRQRRAAGKRRTKKLLRDLPLWRAVLRRLKEKDSPEQVAGKRKRDGKRSVVHETIYRFLYTERSAFVRLLRQQKGRYRRRHGTRKREQARELAKKTWITDRPAIINERTELGHWEGDTIIGREKTTGIATHVERVSGYGFADKLDRITAEAMQATTVQRFAALPQEKRRSETNDNGKEFSSHEAQDAHLLRAAVPLLGTRQ